MPRNVYQKVGLASAVMMASVFLSRIIGLAREVVIAYVAGAGSDVDAYQVAFVIPEILNHVLIHKKNDFTLMIPNYHFSFPLHNQNQLF